MRIKWQIRTAGVYFNTGRIRHVMLYLQLVMIQTRMIQIRFSVFISILLYFICFYLVNCILPSYITYFLEKNLPRIQNLTYSTLSDVIESRRDSAKFCGWMSAFSNVPVSETSVKEYLQKNKWIFLKVLSLVEDKTKR